MDLNSVIQANNQAAGAEVTTAEVSNETAMEDTKSIVIVATNPTAEEMQAMCSDLAVNYNFQVDVKPSRFNFKKQVDKDTGIETTRQAVEIPLPVPSVEGIVAILKEGGKQLDLLMDAVEGIVQAAAREIISEDTSINASNFPFGKISWEAISNMPKAQRRGGGIPKETWEDFMADYITVMPGITGKTRPAGFDYTRRACGPRGSPVRANPE